MGKAVHMVKEYVEKSEMPLSFAMALKLLS